MFSIIGSIAKTVVTTYSSQTSKSLSKQPSNTSSSSGNSQSSVNTQTKTKVQSNTLSSLNNTARKVAEGIIVSISDQAKSAAAKAGVTSGTVTSTLHKGQFMQADKGIHHKNMVDIGYSPAYKPPTNPPRTPNMPDSEVYYTHQNSSHEASGNKSSGQITLTNGTRVEVISEQDPFNNRVNEVYNNYKYSNKSVTDALKTGDRLALNAAIVTLKEAHANADQATRKAVEKLADELRDKGATIGSNVTLDDAKKQVAKEAFNKALYSFGIDAIPVGGDIKAIVESVTGKDSVSGKELSLGERIVPALAIGLPGKMFYKAGETAVDALKGVGKSVDKGAQLTDAQKATLNRLDNLINDHLKESDFSGAKRDIEGNPVPRKNGGFYDHLGEMNDTLRGLQKIKRSLEGSLKNPNMSSEAKKTLEEALEKTDNYIERIHDTIGK